MPTSNAVPPHTHDERYVSKRQYDVRTGATRTVFGQQRRWPIQEGHSLLLPDADIDANAEIVIGDGGELALVGGGGMPDHTDLFGLTDDDHTQYALLAGRSGGQTLIGGTAANDDLTLEGTSDATKTTSYVILQPNGGNVGVGTVSPGSALTVDGAGDTTIQANSTTAAGEPTFLFGNATRYWDLRIDGSNGTFNLRDISAGNLERLVVKMDGNVGIGNSSPGGKLEVNQSSSTAAIPTVVLKQADLSEEFIEFNGTVAAGNPIDTAALGAYYGKIRVSVNGTFKYIALYDS